MYYLMYSSYNKLVMVGKCYLWFFYKFLKILKIDE